MRVYVFWVVQKRVKILKFLCDEVSSQLLEKLIMVMMIFLTANPQVSTPSDGGCFDDDDLL